MISLLHASHTIVRISSDICFGYTLQDSLVYHVSMTYQDTCISDIPRDNRRYTWVIENTRVYNLAYTTQSRDIPSVELVGPRLVGVRVLECLVYE